MPIISTDIKFYYSVASGSAGDSTAGSAATTYEGKWMSNTQWTGGTLDDLFSDVTGAENAGGQVDYRCIFIYNTNATNTFITPVIWFSALVSSSGATTKALGLDTTAASPYNSSSQQALTIANSTTAPTGVTFSTPTTFASGISLGSLLPGYVVAVWIQRTAINGVALNNDGFTLGLQGNTGG